MKIGRVESAFFAKTSYAHKLQGFVCFQIFKRMRENKQNAPRESKEYWGWGLVQTAGEPLPPLSVCPHLSAAGAPTP